jgi:hypothetical protein
VINTKFLLGTLLWVVGFNLVVALIAIDYGIGWSIMILFLRHILLGIPVVYKFFRDFLPGSKERIKAQDISGNGWPTRRWLIETIALSIFSLIVIIWFNYPLRILLFEE